jgi:hypothetical protein
MTKNTAEVMVFVRIGLYILAGKALAGGWLPAEVAEYVKSPEVIEVITGLVLSAGTVLWYWKSQAHAALKSR